MTPREWSALVKRREADLERRDWRAALVASVIANVHRDPKRRRKPYMPADFMPNAPEQPLLPAEALLLHLKVYAAEWRRHGRKKVHGSG